MNDLRYFRNDKLDLVNKEKQRFGFRKLSSGKIASVLLGVTIFGSFALNGQVVKADTTTDGSQKSAVVDEAKNRQTDEEEQFGQDASAQKDSDNLGGEETTEADQGKLRKLKLLILLMVVKLKLVSPKQIVRILIPKMQIGRVQPLIKTVRGLLLR